LDLSRVETAPEFDVQLSPYPYSHFTLKECVEQPEAIARALSYGARMDGKRIVLGGLDKNEEMLAQIRNMMLTACGTSR
jgi:glucosamine--fructose-6-phosphate aminotransferase (isomerizing)